MSIISRTVLPQAAGTEMRDVSRTHSRMGAAFQSPPDAHCILEGDGAVTKGSHPYHSAEEAHHSWASRSLSSLGLSMSAQSSHHITSIPWCDFLLILPIIQTSWKALYPLEIWLGHCQFHSL